MEWTLVNWAFGRSKTISPKILSGIERGGESLNIIYRSPCANPM